MNQFSVIQILREMTSAKIDYFVMRGFQPIEQLEREGGDVDIYVSPKHRHEVITFLARRGFYAPHFNPARYAHKQYKVLRNNRIYMLDLHFDFFFGEKLLGPRGFEAKPELLDGVRVIDAHSGLRLFLYHLAFDKGKLSDNNKLRLQEMINSHPRRIDDLVVKARMVLGGKKSMPELRRELMGDASYGTLRYIWGQLIMRRLMLLCYGVGKYTRNRTVAIVGIDGSGKSTTIEELQKRMPDKLRIQYMGNKNWRSRPAKKFASGGNKVLALASSYYEMWQRLISSRLKPQITIFDRYAWETYYLASRPARPLFFLLYCVLPPKPKLTYYLHCPVEVSLERKDDIENPKKFIETKRKTDAYFRGRKGVVSIDTSKLAPEEIVDRILKDMGEHMLPYFY